MNHTPEALQLARELDTKAQALGCPLDRFSDALRHQHARIADLEAQLYAIGAGGVGASIQPPVQPDTAPAAWAICSDDGTAIRLWSKDKATAQDAADKFGLPLVPLYTAPQPARQPLTDEQIKAAVRHLYGSDAVAAMAVTGDIETARAIEAAHGITGSQQ
ncbi:MAG: hypothetical protein ACMV1D_11870 [Macromonas sp.]